MSAPLVEPVARLIEAFARLPGIGPKTAQRLTFHLLRAPEAEARSLAAALDRRPRRGRLLRASASTSATGRCCPICLDPSARPATGCASSRSRSTSWPSSGPATSAGCYHVLHGAISPIDGIGPDRLRIRELLARVDEAGGRRRAASPRSSSPPTRRSRARRRRCTSPSGSTAHVGVVTRIARGHPGRRRPRVRRRGHPGPGPPGPAGDGAEPSREQPASTRSCSGWPRPAWPLAARARSSTGSSTGPAGGDRLGRARAPRCAGSRRGLRPARRGEPHLSGSTASSAAARRAAFDSPGPPAPTIAPSRPGPDGSGGGPLGGPTSTPRLTVPARCPNIGSVAPGGPDSARTLHLNK